MDLFPEGIPTQAMNAEPSFEAQPRDLNLDKDGQDKDPHGPLS